MAKRPSSSSGTILPIQYLRGIAALMVTWHHAGENLPGVHELLPTNFGRSGVDLFFVVSGFIMAETTQRGTGGPGSFLWRRIIRVVPLYWLLTLAMVALALVAPSLFRSLKVTPQALVESLLFIPHYSSSFPDSIWPLLVPGWTLNFEMFFYVMLALSLFLPKGSQLATLVMTFIVLIAAGEVLGPFDSAVARTYTDPVLLEFVGGALLGRAWSRGQLDLPAPTSVAMITAGSVLLVVREHSPLGVWGLMLGALAVVAGLLNTRWSRLGSAPLKALGDSSYSLYLTHLFALGAVRFAWGRLFPGQPALPGALACMLLAVGGCTITGWLAYRWIEAPLLRRMQPAGRAASSAPRATPAVNSAFTAS